VTHGSNCQPTAPTPIFDLNSASPSPQITMTTVGSYSFFSKNPGDCAKGITGTIQVTGPGAVGTPAAGTPAAVAQTIPGAAPTTPQPGQPQPAAAKGGSSGLQSFLGQLSSTMNQAMGKLKSAVGGNFGSGSPQSPSQPPPPGAPGTPAATVAGLPPPTSTSTTPMTPPSVPSPTTTIPVPGSLPTATMTPPGMPSVPTPPGTPPSAIVPGTTTPKPSGATRLECVQGMVWLVAGVVGAIMVY